MAEPLLVVDRVSQRFGGLLAVDAASLSAPAGRITALIGPNGAGKTTLFAIISGFLKPSAGSIRYNGEEITGEQASETLGHAIDDEQRLSHGPPPGQNAMSGVTAISVRRRRCR